jgi:hypothetical protein
VSIVYLEEHPMKKPAPGRKTDPSLLITMYISELGDWRTEALTRLREIILRASPGITEAWKWDTPVWEANSIVCVAGAFKEHVKLTFPKGASLKDPKRLFNASLEGKTWRAIDFHQGDKIDAAGVKGLVRDAVTLNAGSRSRGQAR